MPENVFHPDVARAATLPARWYRDPGILAREHERVFAATWQAAAPRAALREPGDFASASVAGEPVLLVRGEDRALRALSNVCRHRAGPVCAGSGQRKVLQCGYHGWTYALDGRLLGTPEFEGVEDFPREEVRLPAFAVAEWGPYAFVNLDGGAPPLAEALGAIVEETSALPLERLVLHRGRDYEVGCNWKTYVDNYLEGYHIPIVHPALFRELDYAGYRVEPRGLHSKQHAPLRVRGEGSVYARAAAEDPGREVLYYWVFPNLMLNVYPDNLQVNVVLPLGPERTLTRFEWYVLDPVPSARREDLDRALELADQVQREDVAICEAVQAGLRSRTYDRGRYSVRRENGVHHFHGLLARYLGEGA